MLIALCEAGPTGRTPSAVRAPGEEPRHRPGGLPGVEGPPTHPGWERCMEEVSILMAYEAHPVLEVMSTHLEGVGFHVTRASGQGHEELLDLLRRHRFDVVIVSRIMEPDQRDIVIKHAKAENPDTVIVLIGSNQHARFDHDTVSFAGWDYVLSPSGRPELWPCVMECLERAELEQRDLHARDLIRKFKQQVSTISAGLSRHIGSELREIREGMERVRGGGFGPLPEDASSQLEVLEERIARLIRETELLSKGFVPRRMSSG